MGPSERRVQARRLSDVPGSCRVTIPPAPETQRDMLGATLKRTPGVGRLKPKQPTHFILRLGFCRLTPPLFCPRGTRTETPREDFRGGSRPILTRDRIT